MKQVWSSLLALVLTSFVGAAPLLAQGQADSGVIEGRVTDETGAVKPGVAVTIKNAATGVVRDTTSDAKGFYRAPLLPVGGYEVSAEAQGFAPTRHTKLVLTVGETLTVDLELKVAAAQDVVDVTAEAPLIETARNSQSATVGEKEVQSLPVNGRNFIDFVLTTPGVTSDVRQGDLSFDGQRGTLNSLVVDGADDNNTFFGQTTGRTGSGRAPYQFSQEAVQEFQVNRDNYSAEYGRAGAAVINVVTKAGTNVYHGSAFEYYRDRSLNSNSFANELAGLPKSPYHFNQFGASLGGPLQTDRLFMFLNYDGQRNTTPNTISLTQNLAGITLPTDPRTQAGLATLQANAGSWQRGLNQDTFLGRADWVASEGNRFTLRYNRQSFTGTNFENGGATNSMEHTGDSNVTTDTLNGALASILSSTLFNEARVQYGRDNEPGDANSTLPEATVRQNGRTILVLGRNFFSPRFTDITRWQAGDALSWANGDHNFKAGADFLHDDIKNFFPGNFSGSYTFSSIAEFASGIPDTYVQAFPGPGTTGPTTQPNSHQFAAFAQDDWRLSRNLNLTLGLRYDLQSFAQGSVRNPDPQLAAAGIDTSKIPTDHKDIAPRLGFAWSANDKMVVRGGYGLFYGTTPAIMVGTALSNNGVNVETITFTGAQVPTYPNVLTALPTGVTLPKPTIFIFDQNYQNPRVQQGSLGTEYQIGSDYSLGADFEHVSGDHLQRSRDFNIGTPVPTLIPIQGGGSLLVDRFPSARPFSDFARIIRFESTAKSRYNGFTLELRRRYKDGLLLNLSYTLSKVTDTVPDATAVVPASSDDAKFASNPADFNADNAPGANDQRHRFITSGVYELLAFRNTTGWRRALYDGWSVSWIAIGASGLPYTRTVTGDLNNDGNTRNDIVPGSRDALRLPWSLNVDLRLSKRLPVSDRFNLVLLGEAFNLFNRNNINSVRTGFYTYDAVHNILIPQSSFGTQIGASDNRIFQLAARFEF